MKRVIKVLFFALFVKPLVFIVLGLNLRGRENLPKKTAVIAPNHNSHLDTLVIMSLYPLNLIHKVRPIGAGEYFFKNKYIAWFSKNCLDILPLYRNAQTSQDEFFKSAHKALDDGDILILFPEGSRGKPEEMTRLRKGLFYLLKDRPNTNIVPVFMKGLGNSLPKGEALFVPFICQITIGEKINMPSKSQILNEQLKEFYSKNLERFNEQ